LGLRNWQKLLYRLGVILTLLVGLQVLLVALLAMAGLLPFELSEISALQWGSVWLGGASATTLVVLQGFRLGTREAAPRGSGSVLPAAIPLRVTHDCVVLARAHGFLAVGFVTLASRWTTGEGRRILEMLYATGEPVSLIIARTLDQQERICLAVPRIGDTPELAIKGAIRASETLQQALNQREVRAQRVVDPLGVEELYWLCVLGKAFHEDVELRAEGRLVTARVGGNPLRFLATLELQPGTLEELRGDHRPVGLLHLVDSRRPFLVTIALKPIPPEVVAQRLRQLAAKAPDMALLAEALGEAAATRAYAESQSPAMAEAALLLAGRKEGLWQTSYRLICGLADAPVLTEDLAFTPHLLGPRGFTETATTQVGPLEHTVASNSLLDLLGQPRSRGARHRERARRAQEEPESEAN
jgi:hypothetical protein